MTPALGPAALIVAALSLAALPGPARSEPAPERFSATYGLRFLGLPVGQATLTLDKGPEAGGYGLDLTASLQGLVGFFVDGTGRARASGRLGPGGAVPADFSVESRYAGKPIRVAMRLSRGAVTSLSLEPEPTPRPDRVPLAPKDRTGIVDPLSALAVPAGSAPLDPALCERRIPVFDGATRADLVLSRGALAEVTEGPYRGPALECRIRWVPIAGHRANGPTVRRMAENDEMRVRLAPIPGGGLLLPLSISVATGWGEVRIDATAWGRDKTARSASAEAGRTSVRVSLPRVR
ncbi:hypothetical protein J2X36_000542 [Methylobacterium sp. BE186]|uniref:DUF3108 domain-containing protein n=1 Tax=Methylobacterium sp. BE186 TaxID=2817715 RepID=UPI00285DA254|nr:DUF3108 domain-containing protein [Methylobacterium sp. BE186]MDR7035806.1 hypothetical protein [Methylobacterium sp. BE186]